MQSTTLLHRLSTARKWSKKRLVNKKSFANEKQEKAADEEALALLQRFSGEPGIEKARADFRKAQEVEERFHHDFDGVDFTMR